MYGVDYETTYCMIDRSATPEPRTDPTKAGSTKAGESVLVK